MIRATPCLDSALGPEAWSTWKAQVTKAHPHLADALAESGRAHGAMAPEPGSGRGVARVPDLVALVGLPPAEVVRAALTEGLPAKIQHMLATVEETVRDMELDEALLEQARDGLTAAKQAWKTSTTLSPALAYLQLQGCSGHGHEWLLEAGFRLDRLGRPRQGRGGWGLDEPLSWYEFRTAVRLHLMPVGSVFRAAQKESNPTLGGDWRPRSHCRPPITSTTCSTDTKRLYQYVSFRNAANESISSFSSAFRVETNADSASRKKS
jgi:hypothetical protein